MLDTSQRMHTATLSSPEMTTPPHGSKSQDKSSNCAPSRPAKNKIQFRTHWSTYIIATSTGPTADNSRAPHQNGLRKYNEHNLGYSRNGAPWKDGNLEGIMSLSTRDPPADLN